MCPVDVLDIGLKANSVFLSITSYTMSYQSWHDAHKEIPKNFKTSHRLDIFTHVPLMKQRSVVLVEANQLPKRFKVNLTVIFYAPFERCPQYLDNFTISSQNR
jgi:hypothetical protein